MNPHSEDSQKTLAILDNRDFVDFSDNSCKYTIKVDVSKDNPELSFENLTTPAPIVRSLKHKELGNPIIMAGVCMSACLSMGNNFLS